MKSRSILLSALLLVALAASAIAAPAMPDSATPTTIITTATPDTPAPTPAPTPTPTPALRPVDYDALNSTSCMVKVGGGLGSGVLVTREIGGVTHTYVWTAAHVVASERQEDGSFKPVKIVQEFRTKGKASGKCEVQANVIRYSDPEKGEDLALLEIDQPNFKPLAVSAKFYLDGKIPEVGTPVVHVGCVVGLYNSASEGIISQTDRKLRKQIFDQTSAMGYPGSSGGGVYLRDGRCIGLLTRGVGPGINFIVPMRRIQAWAKAQNLEWALDASKPMPTAEELQKIEVDTTPKAEDKNPLEIILESIINNLSARYHQSGRVNGFFRRAVA